MLPKALTVTLKTDPESALHGVLRLDAESRAVLTRLATALAQKCDAVGECGHKCTLRAGHPGDLHEEYRSGRVYRYRLTGPVVDVREA
jgi:hypothetical protein